MTERNANYIIPSCCHLPVSCRNLVDRCGSLGSFKSQIVVIIIPIGKRPLGRPRGRWEDNIRMDLKVVGINGRNWVDSAQDRDYWRALVNVALNLRVPYAMELVNILKIKSVAYSSQGSHTGQLDFCN